MHRSAVRLILIPTAAAAVAAGALIATSPAYADVTDTGGSATVTVPFSYLGQLGNADVHVGVLSPATATADSTNNVVNVAFPVTGGNADASKLFGSLYLGGSLKIVNDDDNSQGDNDGQSALTLTNVFYSVDNQAIEATPAGSTTPVALLDLGGSIVGSFSGTSQTVTASQLTVDPAGASYLDSTLHTNAFTAGQNAGSFTATWTVSGS